MLTGLLSVSSGEAYLFGKAVNANDMQTRQRVGFMSQAFSLYGELTVAQKMTLHARWFHLAPAQAAQRINTLIIRHFCLPFCRGCHRIFLGTIAHTMAQFALLVLMVIMPMVMLSGGLTPIESQPDIIQPLTWLLPSRHYMEFSQAVVFRGAGINLVWPQLTIIIALGAAFFIASLAMFRRSLKSMT